MYFWVALFVKTSGVIEKVPKSDFVAAVLEHSSVWLWTYEDDQVGLSSNPSNRALRLTRRSPLHTAAWQASKHSVQFPPRHQGSAPGQERWALVCRWLDQVRPVDTRLDEHGHVRSVNLTGKAAFWLSKPLGWGAK